MQNIFLDSRKLDRYAREHFFLTEDSMIENVSAALEREISSHLFHESGRYISRPCVLILAGPGNNGADGYALARRIVSRDVSVAVCCVREPETESARLQRRRAESLGVLILNPCELDSFAEEKSFDIAAVVDCIYGAGFHLPLDEVPAAVISCANNIEAFKAACDVPSGLDALGNGGTVFRSDVTVCAGALKLSLFSDKAKDFCGRIAVCSLGISRSGFEAAFQADAFLLEKSEMKLPFRTAPNVHKGSFGHVAVVCGEKRGAAELASSAAFGFGAGLVTLAGTDHSSLMHIMASMEIPEKANAVVLGCGLGRTGSAAVSGLKFLSERKKTACVLDADIFYYKEIRGFLESRNSAETVLTPHPKEFSVLLEQCGLGAYSAEETVEKRIELVKKFCSQYRNCVLLLKGSVTVIGMWKKSENRPAVYFNPYGTASLAKGGTGDVLSGLIASLLAQGYDGMNAAVTASLAHSFASREFRNSFSLTPQGLIEKIQSFDWEVL